MSEKSTFLIDTVALNVLDLETMTAFYLEKIGLVLKSQSATEVTLGLNDNHIPLIHLIKTTQPRPRKATGLYHVAFLVPDRAALGNVLAHLLEVQYPLVGASNHGYSEAIYLNDPEGNGIEIYRDKPRKEWDIRENGQIIGVTEPMDAKGVLEAADSMFTGMSAGTTIGHVHLSAWELEQTTNFYRDLLGLTVTSYLGQSAVFMGADGYHHHIAANLWSGKGLSQLVAGDQGLAYIAIQVSATIFKELVALNELSDNVTNFELVDTNGIPLRIQAISN